MSSGLFQKSDTSSDNEAISQIANTEQVVRAINFNGEILPYINLPVVEITGSINTDDLVKAIVVEGEVVPMIELDEIIITPNSGSNSI